jgi:hypothetical protein
MLRIVAYLNEKKVDEIRIQNTSEKNEDGMHIYKVIMPNGYNIVVPHDRNESWHVLGEKVLNALNLAGYNSLQDRLSEELLKYNEILRKETEN